MYLKAHRLSAFVLRQLNFFPNLITKASKTLKRSVPNVGRAFLLGAGVTLSFGYVCGIEDEAIRNLKALMNK